MRLDEFVCSGWPGTMASGWPGRFLMPTLQVEPQSLPCAFSGSGPWQTEAVTGQDGLHILVEVKMLRGLGWRPGWPACLAADGRLSSAAAMQRDGAQATRANLWRKPRIGTAEPGRIGLQLNPPFKPARIHVSLRRMEARTRGTS